MSSFKIADQEYWSGIWSKIDTKEQQRSIVFPLKV